MMNMNLNILRHTRVWIAVLTMPFLGCEKYLENTKLPSGTIAGTDAFVSDNSVASIVTGTFLGMNGSNLHNAAPQISLYTDELTPLPGTTSNTPNWSSYQNAIAAANINYWSSAYSRLYAVNSTIEGILATPARLYYRDQWLGESYFTRAYVYYYLVNLYGDAVLALTSDYSVNNNLGRAPEADVYGQMVKDLLAAKALLPAVFTNGYGQSTNDRARPNKGTAGALLAKIYLTTKEWARAEAEADTLINNKTTYQLVKASDVFLTNSKETIWSLALKNDDRTSEYGWYNNGMPSTITADPAKTYSVQLYMSPDLVSMFDAGDARLTNWMRATTYTGVTPAITYYFPNKYKSNVAGAERTVLLRLSDMYLTRAEARAQQNNQEGARADLDSVRVRAGLDGTTALTRDELLAAIARERQMELFTECGNRFFDLKRTGMLDAVMSVVAPQKGAEWEGYKKVWPIPASDITYNPNIIQNDKY